jgi:peptide/nickel transport system permease protein
VIGFIIRRVFQSVLVCLGVLVIVYVLFSFEGPVELARSILGSTRATPHAIQVTINQYGFNRPIWVQLWRAIDNYLHLNFGVSAAENQPVATLIRTAMPRSLLLVGASTVLALIVALPLGIFQVVRRNKASDYVLTTASFIFYAMPPYLLGILLILLFAVHWHIFAPNILPSESVWQIATSWKQITLPMFTLAALTVASFSRYMRSSMMDALTEDYVRTARAKGAGEGRVLIRHAFRNALIPIITLIGLSLPTIAGGAVITETVFNYPGMGYLTTQAALQNDVPVVIGTTIVATVLTVVGSLLADILYAIADPRIRFASRR